MSNALISLILALGAGAFVYSKLGRRLGYGNSQRVWLVVGITVVLVFIVVITLLDEVIHIH